MSDRDDLIRRLEAAAKKADDMAKQCAFDIVLAGHHDARASLLREAAKALKGGE